MSQHQTPHHQKARTKIYVVGCPRKYSDSFQLNRLDGCYSGLDSASLSNQGAYKKAISLVWSMIYGHFDADLIGS